MHPCPGADDRLLLRRVNSSGARQGKDAVKLLDYHNPLKKGLSLLILPIAIRKHARLKASMLQDIEKGKAYVCMRKGFTYRRSKRLGRKGRLCISAAALISY